MLCSLRILIARGSATPDRGCGSSTAYEPSMLLAVFVVCLGLVVGNPLPSTAQLGPGELLASGYSYSEPRVDRL